jgi:hypothetical protein
VKFATSFHCDTQARPWRRHASARNSNSGPIDVANLHHPSPGKRLPWLRLHIHHNCQLYRRMSTLRHSTIASPMATNIPFVQSRYQDLRDLHMSVAPNPTVMTPWLHNNALCESQPISMLTQGLSLTSGCRVAMYLRLSKRILLSNGQLCR